MQDVPLMTHCWSLTIIFWLCEPSRLRFLAFKSPHLVRSTKKQLLLNSLLHLPEDSEAYPVVDYDFKQGRPIRQWLVGLGVRRLTRLNLFPKLIKLLVVCAGLEPDVARFGVRDRGIFIAGEELCKQLCGHRLRRSIRKKKKKSMVVIMKL